ncbi:MAG: metallophosphoesterase family protein [Terriglobia bacterium]
MRWLILSDIHSNMEALHAVLGAGAREYDQVLCLGDVVGYGPDPNLVVEWVRENVRACVRGNHDKVACGIDDASQCTYEARVAALWTRGQLTPNNLQYLERLPQGPMCIQTFQIVHGSIGDEDRYIVTQPDAWEEFRNLATELVFFGHTHHQGGYFLDVTDSLHELKPSFFRGCSRVALELLPGEKYLLNPGSVGQPRDGDNRAAFAIYDAERQQLEYWRVPYNVEATQIRMEECDLPAALIQRLSFGH